MSTPSYKKLGEIISVSKGKKHTITETPSVSSKRVLGIDDLRNDNLLRYTDDPSGTSVLPEDLLIAWDGANAGTIGYGKSGYIGSTIARLRVNEKKEFFTPFLGTFLKSKFDYLRQTATGATIPHISRKALDDIQLPDVNIHDQIRIAHLLGKVESLIAQRKQHLQQLDDLLKSVFLEMFGDPVRNEKGWERIQFSNLLDAIESGKSPKCEAREATNDEWGVLKLGAVTRCYFDEKENKALPQGVLPSVRDEVRAGDLLFSRKNTYELVAACAYVFNTRPKLLMPDLIFRFVFKQNANINKIFMWKLLTNDSQRKAIQSLAAGAAGSMPNISKANLNTVRLSIPPIEIQNKFSFIVEKVERIKSLYQQSLKDLESLNGVLSQQAFKGEMDLSRVSVPNQLSSLTYDSLLTYDTSLTYDTLISNETTIALSDLTDITSLLDADSRKVVIARWLSEYLNQIKKNTNFSLTKFMNAVNNKFQEITEKQIYEVYEIEQLGSNDYDHIKTLIFNALASGKLLQKHNESENAILLLKNHSDVGSVSFT